jgi:hypothetical protein
MCMNMNILITESQHKMILNESIGQELVNIIKKYDDLGKSITSQIKQILGSDKFGLLTFSASVGGFVGPVQDFLENRFPTMNDVEISLLLTGVISTFFYNSPTLLRKIKKLIVEHNLENEFKETISKTKELKNVFFDFMESLNITLFKVSNILGFTFLIPLLPMIHELSNSAITSQDINKIVKIIISYGVITISSVTLKEILTKLIKRFRS